MKFFIRPFPLLLLIISITITSCGDVIELLSSCGHKDSKILEIHTKHNGPGDKVDRNYLRADQMQSRLDGNVRVFFVDVDVTGACTHEHAKVNVHSSAKFSSGVEPAMKARADWGLLFGSEIPVERKISQFGKSPWAFWRSSDYDIGLKQVYGDGPGLFNVRMEFSFLSVGDLERDKQWLEDSFGFSAVITATYHHHKDE